VKPSVDPVDRLLKDKKQTYWKIWECKDKTFAWVLFFTDTLTGIYHTGEESSEEKCMSEIRWIVGSHLIKQNNLL